MILAIYGTGGLGREVLEIVNKINKTLDDIIFIDDINFGRNLDSIKVLSFEEAIRKYKNFELKFVIAVGEPELRRILFDKVVYAGYSFETLIHPTVDVPSGITLGRGVVICKQSVFNCKDIIIGDNVYVQPHVVIGHDIKIGSHSIIAPLVCIGGATTIGECVYVGMLSAIRENLNIGDHSIIGMGSMVFRDIPEKVIAIGNPARVMRRNENNKVFK